MEKLTVASIPVVFYDGEHESHIGEISIYPSMDFKLFQSILSQTIGISPHQFTVYRVDHINKKQQDLSPPPDYTRRRTPITAKVNFAAIVREKDCLFLVVLKRSRRDRRRRNHDRQYHQDDDFMYYDDPYHQHQQMMMMMRFEQEQQLQYAAAQHQLTNNNNILLLRRNTTEDLAAADLHMNQRPYYDTVSTSDYLTDYHNLSADYYNSKGMQINGFSYNHRVRVCEICRDAATKGSLPEFHCCIYDPILPEFKRCTAGVIARPVKDAADYKKYSIRSFLLGKARLSSI